MTATLDPQTASEVYVHAVEPRPRTAIRRFVLGALDLYCANFGGRLELTHAGDVVVRRRSDGVEELRIEVSSAEEAAETWQRVGEQLEELDPEEFRRAWSMD